MSDAPLPSRDRPRGTGAIVRVHDDTGATGRVCAVPALITLYDGPLGIPLRDDRPTVVANFVQTIDGVVALGREGRVGSGAVSGYSPTDRSMMGLLRAMADVVVVGAGTVRASRGTGWTPDRVHPPLADAYRELRRGLGLASEPTTLIVTGRGDLDPDHPAFQDPDRQIIIAAPTQAVAGLRAAGFRAGIRIEAMEAEDRVTPADILATCARHGARLVLTEGGPTLFGAFVQAGLLDELFLTVAPQIAGRADGVARLSLVEGVALWPEHPRWAELVSIRRADDQLFLRYRSFGAT